MKQRDSYLLNLLIVFSLMIGYLLLPITAFAEEGADTFSVNASAAIAVDMDSGKILYNHNAEEALGIASMTKIISAYIIYREIDEGHLTWDDTVTIDKDLDKSSKNPDLSNVPLNSKLTYTVKDLLEASLISSANAATSALARKVSGSEPDFVDLMRQQLLDWDIQDAYIISASGLGTEDMVGPAYPQSKKTDENMMSARSMAIVTYHVLTDYPEILDISKTPSHTFFPDTKHEYTFWNSNDMLPGFYYAYDGVDGLKTGTTPLAGNCFVGTAVQNNQRIITVVMDVDEDISRFEETGRLMDYAFNQWSYQKVASKGEASITPKLDTLRGVEHEADIVLSDDLFVWLEKDNAKIKRFFEEDKKQVNSRKEVVAPKKAGYEVGTEYVFNKNDTLGYLLKEQEKTATSKVVLKKTLEKNTYLANLWRQLFPKKK